MKINLKLPEGLPQQLVEDFEQLEDLETMTFTEGWQVLMNYNKNRGLEIQQQIDENDPKNSNQVKDHVKGCKLLTAYKKFVQALLLPIMDVIENIKEQLNHNDLFTESFPYTVRYDHGKNIVVIEDAEPKK